MTDVSRREAARPQCGLEVRKGSDIASLGPPRRRSPDSLVWEQEQTDSSCSLSDSWLRWTGREEAHERQPRWERTGRELCQPIPCPKTFPARRKLFPSGRNLCPCRRNLSAVAEDFSRAAERFRPAAESLSRAARMIPRDDFKRSPGTESPSTDRRTGSRRRSSPRERRRDLCSTSPCLHSTGRPTRRRKVRRGCS